MEWQNYITAELHKSFSPLFRPDFNAAAKDWLRAALRKKYEYVAARLRDTDYLTGAHFTAADAYFFVVTSWSGHVGVNITDLEPVQRLLNRVYQREAVQAALKAEGLPLKQAV
jgi:glutathione S-transferase